MLDYVKGFYSALGDKQDNSEIPLPARMGKSKSSIYSTCWQGCGEPGPPAHCWWECMLRKPPVKINLPLSQKTEKSTTSKPSNTILGRHPNDAPTFHKDPGWTMFIATLIIRARKSINLDVPKEWKKVMYIYTM